MKNGNRKIQVNVRRHRTRFGPKPEYDEGCGGSGRSQKTTLNEGLWFKFRKSSEGDWSSIYPSRFDWVVGETCVKLEVTSIPSTQRS